MKSYKIRNAGGLFSTGGSRPTFTKRGKTWNCIGHVQSHLTMLREYASIANTPLHEKDPYQGCEIIEYACIQGPIKKIENLKIL